MPDMQQLAESKERALVCKEEYWERFLSFCAAMRNVCGGVPADMDATFSSLSEGSASYAQIAHLHAAYCKLAPALISRGSTHFVRSHVSTEGARLAPVAEKDMVALGRFHWSATALSSHCDPVVLANCVVTPLEMLLLMFALRMRTKAQIKHRGEDGGDGGGGEVGGRDRGTLDAYSRFFLLHSPTTRKIQNEGLQVRLHYTSWGAHPSMGSTRFFRMRDTPTTLTASFNDLLYCVCDCSPTERQAIGVHAKGSGIQVIRSDGLGDEEREDDALYLLCQMDLLVKQHVISGTKEPTISIVRD
ncbi:hypothetical protein B484DRAFT_457483 [Ochromonadaceae sp. CCMP2298]|nr:hypothetical protein B484DRAFT_457483 [Ochromonadaceae sp. CCMP2298]